MIKKILGYFFGGLLAIAIVCYIGSSLAEVLIIGYWDVEDLEWHKGLIPSTGSLMHYHPWRFSAIVILIVIGVFLFKRSVKKDNQRRKEIEEYMKSPYKSWEAYQVACKRKEGEEGKEREEEEGGRDKERR